MIIRINKGSREEWRKGEGQQMEVSIAGKERRSGKRGERQSKEEGQQMEVSIGGKQRVVQRKEHHKKK
jgi:hypothetical protein